MVALESLRWVLTVAFALTSAYHLARVLRPLRFPEPISEHWISELLHLIMNLAMLAMLWPVGAVVPVPLWVAVFTASTGWFVVRARSASGRRLVPAFFASTMAVMVWMGVSMPASAAPSMPGMPGMAAGARLTTAGLVSGVLGGYLVVAAFWWFFRGLHLNRLPATTGPARPLNWSALCHGVMSIGMGLALLAMA